MPSDTITIYFESEFEFLPLEGMHFDEDFAANVYHELRQPGCGLPYKNLNSGSTVTLSTTAATPHGQMARECDFAGHTLTIRERRTNSTEEEFSDSVTDVLKAMVKARSDHPPIYSLRCRIQALWKPEKCQSPLVLLAHNASRVFDKVNPFGRPPSFFGLRFRFTPATSEEMLELKEVFPDAEEKHDFSTVRYEVYSEDTDYVWIEHDSARYVNTMDIRAFEQIRKIVSDTHRFVTNNGVLFLEQFDKDDSSDDEEDDDIDGD